MNCEEARTLIKKLNCINLTRKQTQFLQQHLDSCVECRKFQMHQHVLKSKTVFDDEAYWGEFYKKIAEEIHKKETFQERMKRKLLIHMPCPFTAFGIDKMVKLGVLILLIISISALLQSGMRQSQNTSQTVDFTTVQDTSGLKIYQLKAP
ncbi:MAG: hypothetical protein N2450_01200 [bacterium]|nr:hypothetical protein [bacterium]